MEAEQSQKISKTSNPGNPDWLVPGYPSLKCDDAVGKAAIKNQTVFYPKVVRTRADPPIINQKFCSHSFMFFKEQRKLRNGKIVYGFFNCRGNTPDESNAKLEASKIVREVDSKYPINIGPTGNWLPLTEETAFCKEMLDVRTDKEEVHLRDQAVKDKESERRRIQREIRDREEEVKHGDVYDDPQSLDFYTMKRVTEMKLRETRNNQTHQISAIRESLRKTRKELKRLERDHTSYTDAWIDNYNKEREKAGIPPYIPGENEFKEYEESIFKNLDESDDDEGKSDKEEDLSEDDYESEEEEVTKDEEFVWEKTYKYLAGEHSSVAAGFSEAMRSEIESKMSDKNAKIKIEIIYEK